MSEQVISVHIRGRGYDVIYNIENDDDVQLAVKILERLRKDVPQLLDIHGSGD